MPLTRPLPAVTLAVLAALALAPVARGQSVSLNVGSLASGDGEEEVIARAYGIRVDHRVLSWLVLEGQAQLAPMRLSCYSCGVGEARIAGRRTSVDVQLQVQPPWRVRPYLGAGVGRFAYRRLTEAPYRRARIDGPMRLFTVGARADLARHLGLRAELRLRHDDPSFGYFPFDGEYSAGIAYRW